MNNGAGVASYLKKCVTIAPLFPAWSVEIREDDYLFSLEKLGPFRVPLPRPHGVTGCGEADLCKVVGVFLAFNDENRRSFQELRKMVGNQRNAFQVPDPTAFAVRVPLPEILREETDGLKERFPALVGVIVFCNDFRLLGPGLRFEEKVFEF